MELASWLSNKESFPILGLNSYDTFLKICKEFAQWALDDIGLATRNDAYKIWVCPVKISKLKEVKGIIERYSSMKLLLQYYNMNIIENKNISFYTKLDWLQNKWIISYGITNNKKLFKVGEFDYNIGTKLPESEILKYVKNELDDFNPREHLILYTIKKDSSNFNPGYCSILDPVLLNKEITITTYNLGIWNSNGLLENGESEKYLEVLKSWVKTQKWWNLVTLIVRPKQNNVIDFILKLK